MNALKKLSVRELPKYYYPDHVLTVMMLQEIFQAWNLNFLSNVAIASFCHRCPKKAIGKSIYGGGLLLSNRKAAAEKERAATQRTAAEEPQENMRSAYKWELSDKERELIAKMSQ